MSVKSDNTFHSSSCCHCSNWSQFCLHNSLPTDNLSVSPTIVDWAGENQWACAEGGLLGTWGTSGRNLRTGGVFLSTGVFVSWQINEIFQHGLTGIREMTTVGRLTRNPWPHHGNTPISVCEPRNNSHLLALEQIPWPHHGQLK